MKEETKTHKDHLKEREADTEYVLLREFGVMLDYSGGSEWHLVRVQARLTFGGHSCNHQRQ